VAKVQGATEVKRKHCTKKMFIEHEIMKIAGKPEGAGSGIRVSQMNIKYQYKTITPPEDYLTCAYNANSASCWKQIGFLRKRHHFLVSLS